VGQSGSRGRFARSWALDCAVIAPRTELGLTTASPLAEDAAGNIWIGSDIDMVRWQPTSSSVYAPAGLASNGGISGVHPLAAADGSVWVGIERRGPGLGLEHLTQGEWKAG
jgi:ligand-binding sensor domain-containing protein